MRNLLPHEFEAGYRYCSLCDTWKPKKKFAVNSICHGGHHPLCLLHISQGESETREGRAFEILTKSGLHPVSRLSRKA